MRKRQRPRSWGFWSELKLSLLKDYLEAFTTASKGQSRLVYLDAFAGQTLNVSRTTGTEFHGSARIALEVSDPPFTQLRYFELKPERARELEATLRRDYPGRDIVVYPEDCNIAMMNALRDLENLRWAPTFAFLDPDGMQLKWMTLQKIADHKKGYRTASTKPEFKVEMWMLFPSQGLMRTLAHDPEKLRESDVRRASDLFGTEEWRAIHRLRVKNEIDGAEAADEYLNLMRWRLEDVLGYDKTHPLEVRNSIEGRMYHMILATDHPTGTKIITSLYNKAAHLYEEMRQEALLRKGRSYQLRLLLGGAEALYEYQSPRQPMQP